MNFKKTTVILFSIIAVLLSLTIFLFTYFIDKVENEGLIINISGRQRMLSQKITKLCLQIENFPENKISEKKSEELKSALALFEASHYYLIGDREDLDLGSGNSKSTAYLFSSLQSDYEKIVSIGNSFTAQPISNSYDKLQELFEAESDFLFKMNEIVFEYTKENNSKIEEIKLYMVLILAFIILVLFFELKFVLLPIIKKEKNHKVEILESNKTKDKFFSIISHDLKGPFYALLELSKILHKDYKKLDKDEVEFYINSIHNTSKNTYNLLENLLTWSRTQLDKIEFSPEVINVKTLVKDVALLSQPILEKKGISLIDTTQLDMTVYVDKNMISLVLRNLIMNAIKFTDNNGKIVVGYKKIEKQDFIEISLIDSGIGIPNDKILDLFKITSNKSTPDTENKKGTGLGLILCKEFIDKHGGKIWAESEVGKGSKFVFTLPVK